jgi:hypothetical protein
MANRAGVTACGRGFTPRPTGLSRPRAALARVRAPRPVDGPHLRRQHVFPARVHDAIDRQLEGRFRRARHVSCVAEHPRAGGRLVDEPGPPCEVELVAAGLRLGEALQRVPAIAQQIAALRRGRGDEHVEAIVREDGAHRMQPWSPVLPDGGEEGQPDLELEEQRAADLGEVGLGGGELPPRDHRATSPAPGGAPE